MKKLFEIFKSQEDLKRSIPKISIVNKEENMEIFHMDNKRVQISYTFLMFISIMIIIILMIVYIMGYIKSESNTLSRMLAYSPKNIGLPAKNNTIRNLGDLNKTDGTSKDIKTEVKFVNKFADKKIAENNEAKDYVVELYFGILKPEQRFLTNLKKIVRNIMNIDVDVYYFKKGKNFYIILSSLNTESEANRVIELLRAKKMISKANGKVLVKE